MWSFGRYDLKLSDDQFWALSPKEYRSLSDRHVYHNDILDIRSGVIASVIANAMGGKKDSSEGFTAADFFPSIKKYFGRKGADGKPAAQSVDEQIVAMQTWTTVFQQHSNRGTLPEKPLTRLPESIPVEVLPQPEG